MRIKFKINNDVDIVIIGQLPKEIEYALLKSYTYKTVIPKRDIFINISIVYRMLRGMLSSNFYYCSLDRNRGILYSIVKLLYEAHLISFIKYMQPKIVATFTDNSLLFQRLSAYCADYKFVSIQNGYRPKSEIHQLCLSQNCMPGINYTFFCFGYREQELYGRHNNSCNYIPCGSIKSSVAIEEIVENQCKYPDISYDVCFVSQWANFHSDINKNNLSDINLAAKLNMKIILEHLSKYIVSRKLKLVISLRTTNSAELEFFKSHVDHDVFYSYRDNNVFATYVSMLASKVVITMSSTCGLEAMGFNRSVLFYNPSGFADFDFTGDGVNYIGKKSYSLFADKVDLMLSYNNDQSKNNENYHVINSYLMNYSKDDPTHKVISSFIAANI